MSPILVRPVREQLEHDRVIRLLQAKYKKKFDVAINPGNDQTAPVGTGPSPWYPDLVLYSTERGRKLLGVVEVESVESVNHLEAMSQWAAFARLRAPFHLYVPAAMVDVARRFCEDLQIAVTEIWSYHAAGDQIRFTSVHRTGGGDEPAPVSKGREVRRGKVAAEAARPSRAPIARSEPPKKTAKPTRAAPAAPAVRKSVRNVKAAKSAKPAVRASARKPPSRSSKRK